MRSLTPFPAVHNAALCFLSGKLNKLTPFMDLHPQAIGSPFSCFSTAAPLSVSLPAEEEASGYAENRSRYSNMHVHSPTRSCVFFFEVSRVLFPQLVNQPCDILRRDYVYIHVCVYVPVNLCVIMCFEVYRRQEEAPGRNTPFLLCGCPEAAVLSNSQPSIDSAAEL